MAELPQQLPDGAGLSDLAGAVADEQLTPERLQKQQAHAVNIALDAEEKRDAYKKEVYKKGFTEWAAERIIAATDIPETLLDPLARGALNSLIRDEPAGRHGDPTVGERLLQKLTGHTSSVEPGTDGAARFLTLFINESVEAWLRGVAVELVTEFLPKIAGIGGGVEAVQKLQEVIEHALGGDRMVRRVLQPFISATAITPAQWHVNKQFRPELLAVGETVRQFLRGRWSREQMEEELARQGWSAERIEAHIAAQRKYLSTDDLWWLLWNNIIQQAEALQTLRDQGYDEQTASKILNVRDFQRTEDVLRRGWASAVNAFADRLITRSALDLYARELIPNEREREFLLQEAEMRLALNIRRLSSPQVASLVMDDILAVIDYRHALEREGYPPEDVAALELQLRKRKNEARDLALLKRDQAAERAAEKQRQAEERAARLAETAVAKAQPALADVRKAYVRGHVPIERLVAAIRFAHDGITDDDLAALVAEAEQDRDDYLAAIERRKAAEAANLDEAVPLAKVEDSVLRGILSLDEYARELQTRHYDADESRLLVMLLRTKMEDQEQAQQAREAAAKRAALRGISLPDFERAVRLGLRTIDQYGALLDQLETPEIAKALALDLLRAQMQADAEALAKRQAAEQAAKVKSISLEQRRRAVLRGVRPRSYYEQALRDAGLPVDDQRVELALLDLELQEAEAAQSRRAQVAEEIAARQAREEAQRQARATAAAEPPAPPTLTLAQVERAVKLGLLVPDDLRDYLASRGYDPNDVELLVALVVADVPDTRAAQQRRQQIAPTLRTKGVSLAEFEDGARRGLRTVDAYEALLVSQGYGDDDVLLLSQLLEEEIALDLDGLRKQIQTILEAGPDLPTLDELETALTTGELSAAQAQRFLVAIGVPRDTALVYTRLLLRVGGKA
jgi:hypothetical protein